MLLSEQKERWVKIFCFHYLNKSDKLLQWIVTLRPKNGKMLAKQILDFLRGQGIQILEPVSENEHDFMMGVVLSFPEILTIVIDEVIDKYAKINKVAKPSMEKIMEWAVPASNALFSFYIRSIDSSANWL